MRVSESMLLTSANVLARSYQFVGSYNGLYTDTRLPRPVRFVQDINI